MADTGRMGEHNVIATFGDVADARRAVQALERAGIESGDVVLHGGETDPLSGRQARERDLQVTGHVAKRAAGGWVVGAVLGAAAMIGVLNVIGVEPRLGASIAGGIAGALLFGAIGAFWGGGRDIPVNNEAFEETFATDVDGQVAVTVHVRHADLATKAEEALRQLSPSSVRRYGGGASA